MCSQFNFNANKYEIIHTTVVVLAYTVKVSSHMWVIEHSIEILIFAYNTNAAKTEEEQDTSTQSHLFNHARVNVE